MVILKGGRNVPGAGGNLRATQPHGAMYQQQPRDYLDRMMPKYPPGFGPQQQETQPQAPQPGTPIQLELPLAMRGMSGLTPMGNAGFFSNLQYGQQVPPGFQNKFVS